MILYAPGSFYDDIVKADLAAGIVVVADEDPEPGVGATPGIVEPSSLYCRQVLPVLGNSMFCNTTRETVNIS